MTQKTYETTVELLTEENFLSTYLRFENRQAGVNVVYDPHEEKYLYNAYCLEFELLKELQSMEFEFLDDALEYVNSDFKSWEVVTFDKNKSSCSSCAAK